MSSHRYHCWDAACCVPGCRMSHGIPRSMRPFASAHPLARIRSRSPHPPSPQTAPTWGAATVIEPGAKEGRGVPGMELGVSIALRSTESKTHTWYFTGTKIIPGVVRVVVAKDPHPYEKTTMNARRISTSRCMLGARPREPLRQSRVPSHESPDQNRSQTCGLV